MQTANDYFSLPMYEQKNNVPKKFRLTPRDLDIIEFVLEMKFSAIEDIHSKFFKLTKNGQTSYNIRWARERVAILVNNKMLEALKEVCHRTIYVATMKGYFYLKNSRNHKNYCRPLLDVDSRTFDHDHRVIKNRILLEQKGIVNEWLSERSLFELEEVKQSLSAEFRPDAIYINPVGEKVAFELEIARKSKDRYHQKIKRYIQIMTESSESSRLFDKVHYVCEKQNVLDLVRSETQLYQPLFQFSLEADILNK